jgi:hypothetical protein
MGRKIPEKKPPVGITDPNLAYVVQKIYDDINSLVSSVNNYSTDNRVDSNANVGDIRVARRDVGDTRLEAYSEEGWFTTRKGAMVPLEYEGESENVSSWIEIDDFKNDWTNYGNTTTCAYYKLDDRVYLKGQVKGGTIGQDSIIFTLPELYRPEATNIFATIVSGTSLGRIHVRKSGDVVAFSVGGTGPEASTEADAVTNAGKLLTLDGISFKIKE